MTGTRRSFFALVFFAVVFSAVGDAAAVAKMDEGDRRIFDIRDYGGSAAKAAAAASPGGWRKSP